MRYLQAVSCLAILTAGVVEASAQGPRQGPRDVPVQDDLRQIERDRPPPPDPFVTPDNPDGVVGFDGPPDPIDDGVDGGSPLPPGSPGDADED